MSPAASGSLLDDERRCRDFVLRVAVRARRGLRRDQRGLRPPPHPEARPVEPGREGGRGLRRSQANLVPPRPRPEEVRKGFSLSIRRDKRKLYFFEMLKLECPGKTGRNDNQVGFFEIYAKIQGAVEICLSPEYSMDHITIMIDDLSLLEIAAHGSAEMDVLDFLHYCVTLTSEMDCSRVVLNHEDIYSSSGAPALLSYLEYLADLILKAEPLPTGFSADVHGSLL